MQCQECQKRPATLHFSQVINGKKNEVHVCEVCAMEKGYMSYVEETSLHNLLSGLFKFDSSQIGNHQGSPFQNTSELQCSKCEMTFSDFQRLGKFGCAECYHAFSARLDPILKRVHSGNTKHNGKIPKRKGGHLHIQRQIETYKLELQQLIENEEFEQAAKVRDKIKELKSKENNPEGDNS